MAWTPVHPRGGAERGGQAGRQSQQSVVTRTPPPSDVRTYRLPRRLQARSPGPLGRGFAFATRAARGSQRPRVVHAESAKAEARHALVVLVCRPLHLTRAMDNKPAG